MWIHNQKEWPNFTWNAAALTDKLASIRYQQGKLLGEMANIGFSLRQETNLNTLTSDILTSSAIEGENLNKAEVRSSVAKRLGIDIAGLTPANRHTEGIVEMMLDATQNHSTPLTKSRLFDWHAALFPTGRSGMQQITVGAWRSIQSGPMQVISGPYGSEKIHFEAPHADRLTKETTAFLKWFEAPDTTDPVLKSGIAHLWFLTVHPFEDGNGRIARAISDMILARSEGIKDRFYSLSTQIESERNDYYDQLEKQQRGTTDITKWLGWFLGCFGRALGRSETLLSHVHYKTKLWEKIYTVSVNDRQKLVINRMLEDDFKGYMNTSKYAKIAKCSTDTALRDIQNLKSKSIFIQNPGGGRSTSYRLPDKEE